MPRACAASRARTASASRIALSTRSWSTVASSVCRRCWASRSASAARSASRARKTFWSHVALLAPVAIRCAWRALSRRPARPCSHSREIDLQRPAGTTKRRQPFVKPGPSGVKPVRPARTRLRTASIRSRRISVARHVTQEYIASLEGQVEKDMDSLSTGTKARRRPGRAGLPRTGTRRCGLATIAASAFALAGLFSSAELMASRGVEPSGVRPTTRCSPNRATCAPRPSPDVRPCFRN